MRAGRKKSEFTHRNYDLDVDVNAIYKSELGNYSNSHMTCLAFKVTSQMSIKATLSIIFILKVV